MSHSTPVRKAMVETASHILHQYVTRWFHRVEFHFHSYELGTFEVLGLWLEKNTQGSYHLFLWDGSCQRKLREGFQLERAFIEEMPRSFQNMVLFERTEDALLFRLTWGSMI